MSRDELLKHISINPEVCFGKPCVRGTRIWVSLVLDYLAEGLSIDDILAEHTSLTREDVQACIAYGAELSRERIIPIPADTKA